jgi:glucose/arabinose dehydrogenase
VHQFQFRYLLIFTLFLGCLPLHAEVIVLLPDLDNTLYEDDEGDVSNGAGKGLFFGKTGADGDELLRRALVRFDLSGIPSNAVINSVEVSFVINQVPPSGAADSATLHPVNKDWGEGASDPFGAEGQGAPAQTGDATWLHTFFDSATWSNPGGDYEPLASATAAFGTGNGEVLTFSSSPELIADVTSWVKSPASNHGWILRGDEIRSQNARRVASRECPADPICFEDPPKLTVEYTIPSVVDHLSLTVITAELTNPVSIANAGDGSNRLFVVEQEGLIKIYDTETGNLLGIPFLNISAEVFSLVDDGGGNEQGLLGLAFHPEYTVNGLFYVNYTTNPSAGVWHTVVAEFSVSGEPDVAMAVGQVIMEFEQDAKNHNGGDLHFGADGYLYIASGDGGGANDQYGNAQDIDTLKGGILRIDVDGIAAEGAELCGIVNNYAIPPGNAFPGTNDGCDEILHYGLRNPWRFSFDAVSGELWIADVGQNAWEEVNQVPAAAAGHNFGWPCLEGDHTFNPNAECAPPLTGPVIEYFHDGGNCSITGGYVYRGNRLPLQGRYLYGDWCSKRIWIATRIEGGWSSEEWTAAAAQLNSLSSFGQDENCELYVVDRGLEDKPGAVYRIDDTERLFSDGYEARNCR